MITKYLLKSKTLKEPGVVGYNADGLLVYLNIDNDMTKEQVLWFLSNMPGIETSLKNISKKTNGKLEFEKVPVDISFEAAWRLYAYKHSKIDSKKAWEKLNENDRIACMLSFGKYDAYVSKSKVGKAYLSSYVNGRRWEDEY